MTSCLIVCSDTAIANVLRWAVSELVDDVWTASNTLAASRITRQQHPTVAVVDFDRLSVRVAEALIRELRAESVRLVAVGSRLGLDTAHQVGVQTSCGKPINVGDLMEHVRRLVG